MIPVFFAKAFRRDGRRFEVSVRHLGWALLRLLPLMVATAGITLGVVVLPATMSRAAWLAFAVSMVLYAVRETGLGARLMRRRWVVPGLAMAASVLMAGLFFMKRDSAVGRLHIWNMEVRAISSAPAVGTGAGTALGAYGKAQEAYFRSGDRGDTVTRVAGCPEYAFNEYLKAGMEAGVPGLLLVIAVVATAMRNLLRCRSVFAYALLSAAVFAFFSYPMSVLQTSFCIIVFLAVGSSVHDRPKARSKMSAVVSAAMIVALSAGVLSLKGVFSLRSEAVRDWQEANSLARLEIYEDAVKEYESAREAMSWNYHYLYDYGHALHEAGDYARSNAVLSEGAKSSSDPLFHTISGKNYAALGQYEMAEQEYLTAHFMVPCRIYPLSLLMDLYIVQGQREKATAVGRKILGMPVNRKNMTMVKLQEDVIEKMKRIAME